MPPALDGLRVLETGVLVAGPFCGQLLADFGAEVIKLEQPGVGDPMRQWGREKSGGHSLWWPVLARNKKSVTLNLREPRGQDLVRRLMGGLRYVVGNPDAPPSRVGLRQRRVSRTARRRHCLTGRTASRRAGIAITDHPRGQAPYPT